MKKILFFIFAVASLASGADTTGTWAATANGRLDSIAAYTWNPAAPSAFTGDILLVFDGTSTYNAELKGNITIKRFTTTSGYTGTISLSSYTVTCKENWTMNAAVTLSAGTSTVLFDGTTASIITSAGETFYDITFNKTGGGSQFADAWSAHTVTYSSTNTYGATWSGTTGTVSGNFTADGSGTLHMGNGLTASGASSNVHLGSTLGTVTATSCALTMNTAKAGVIDDDKAVTFLSWTVTNSGDSVVSSGAAASVLIATVGTPLTLGVSAAITINQTIQIRRNTTGDMYSLGSGYILNGSGAIGIGPSAGSITVSFPELTYTGTGAWTIRDYAASVGTTVQFGGAVSINTRNLTVFNALTNGLIFDFNDQNITCGRLAVGNGTGGDVSVPVIRMGNGTFSVTSFDAQTAGITNVATVNMEGCIIKSTGAINLPVKYTLNSGTSTVTATGTGTWTTNSKPLYAVVCSTGAAMTLADSLTCTTFRHVGGTFNAATKSLYCKNLYAGTDTLFLSGLLGLNDSANVQIKSNGALKLASVTDASLSGSAGKLNRYTALTPGSQARLHLPGNATVSYTYFQDINSVAYPIDARDGSSVDGSNNTNIFFPSGGSGISNQWNSRHNMIGIIISP